MICVDRRASFALGETECPRKCQDQQEGSAGSSLTGAERLLVAPYQSDDVMVEAPSHIVEVKATKLNTLGEREVGGVGRMGVTMVGRQRVQALSLRVVGGGADFLCLS